MTETTGTEGVWPIGGEVPRLTEGPLTPRPPRDRRHPALPFAAYGDIVAERGAVFVEAHNIGQNSCPHRP